MSKYLLLGAVMAAGIASAAAANDGFYVAGGVGYNALGATNVRYYDVGGSLGGSGAQDSAETTIRFKGAASFRGTLGYDFGRFRGDLEIDYARNKASSIQINRLNGTAITTLTGGDAGDVCDYLEVAGCTVSGNTISFADGSRVRQLSALANVWLDLPIGKSITPYVGGGAGIAGIEIDGEGKARFAWQLGAGVAFNLSDTVALTLDYRHRQISGTTIAYDASSGFDIGRVRTNALTAGIRLTF
ncbi:outer membrane beta-barrel protein [Sandarakinorhabdus sp.]|uniref:outer membrane protein n=1 Tax=Sandarakinorhabdus sp. TaxID=1916663 RepID=UPI00286E5D5F|nr:outer membrane beta-barrel protein [Sandarakinorhabdus sp.]